MKERPIIFSAEMVRAILENRKTQTRRLAKNEAQILNVRIANDAKVIFNSCPYGRVGDRLWVRETFFDHNSMLNYDQNAERNVKFVEYRATEWDRENQEYAGGWTPSTYMPRWASRITLEIVAVRGERLWEISNDGAVAEGILNLNRLSNAAVCMPEPRELFEHSWDVINGKKAPWGSNPWVWVVEFKRVQP